MRKAVGRTPWSAADALVGLCEPAADQGVRPTILFAAVATFRDKFAIGR